MNRFRITKTLGDGAFGSVLMAENTSNQEIVAIKKMKKKYKTWEECMQLREIKSLKKLHHVNIIRLKEVIRENEELFFVFEYMECNLYQVMESFKSAGKLLGENNVTAILFQIMNGLAHIHNNGFFHRDLKPENILVSQRLEYTYEDDVIRNTLFKIADFGLAREIRSVPPYTDYVATRWYRAPELLLRSTNYSSPVDIWAMGTIAFELYALRPMFSGQSEIDQLFKICSLLGSPISGSESDEWKEGMALANKLGFKFPHCVPVAFPKIMPEASQLGQQLIQDMLKWDPAKRPSASAILGYPLFKNAPEPTLLSRTSSINLSNSQLKSPKEDDTKSPLFSAQPQQRSRPSSSVLAGLKDEEMKSTTFAMSPSIMQHNQTNHVKSRPSSLVITSTMGNFITSNSPSFIAAQPVAHTPRNNVEQLLARISNPPSPSLPAKHFIDVSSTLNATNEIMSPHPPPSPLMVPRNKIAKKSLDNIYDALNSDLLRTTSRASSPKTQTSVVPSNEPRFLQSSNNHRDNLDRNANNSSMTQVKTVYDTDLSDILRDMNSIKKPAQSKTSDYPTDNKNFDIINSFGNQQTRQQFNSAKLPFLSPRDISVKSSPFQEQSSPIVTPDFFGMNDAGKLSGNVSIPNTQEPNKARNNLPHWLTSSKQR